MLNFTQLFIYSDEMPITHSEKAKRNKTTLKYMVKKSIINLFLFPAISYCSTKPELLH